MPCPVLFDLDGTLWDTTEPVALAWNRALERAQAGLESRQVTPADIASIMGLTHEQIFSRLFPDLPYAQREALSELCYEEEELHIRRLGGRLYPGVVEMLHQLAEQCPLAIVSNCQRGYIELFLQWSGLEKLFQDWECHGNTGLSKSENTSLLLRRRGWQQAVFVGDTVGDEVAAQANGCRFIFAAYGFGQASPEAERIAQPLELGPRLLQASLS